MERTRLVVKWREERKPDEKKKSKKRKKKIAELKLLVNVEILEVIVAYCFQPILLSIHVFIYEKLKSVILL
jgi:hypothetical protein